MYIAWPNLRYLIVFVALPLNSIDGSVDEFLTTGKSRLRSPMSASNNINFYSQYYSFVGYSSNFSSFARSLVHYQLYFTVEMIKTILEGSFCLMAATMLFIM